MPKPKLKSRPQDVLCIYRVKPGKEASFKKLLKKHGPALQGAGLSTKKQTIWRAESGRKPGVIYVELMQWKDASSASSAHQMPEVMAVWEPMGNHCSAMEFLDLEPADLG
ncbi:MAG: hypothetical protein IPJ65_16845 [Archangiaceae bacterium]|nr:hypothetical protein [Archangiaceae bacterium]